MKIVLYDMIFILLLFIYFYSSLLPLKTLSLKKFPILLNFLKNFIP